MLSLTASPHSPAPARCVLHNPCWNRRRSWDHSDQRIQCFRSFRPIVSKSKCLIDAIEISNQNVKIHKDLNVEIPKLPKNTRSDNKTRLILWEIIPLSGNKIFSQSWYFWQKNSLEFLFTTIWWWDNAWLSLFLILSKNVRKQDVRKQDFFLKYKFLKIMSNLHRTKSELS